MVNVYDSFTITPFGKDFKGYFSMHTVNSKQRIKCCICLRKAELYLEYFLLCLCLKSVFSVFFNFLSMDKKCSKLAIRLVRDLTMATFYPGRNWRLEPTFQNRQGTGKIFCLEGMIAFVVFSKNKQTKKPHIFLILNVQHVTTSYREAYVVSFSTS